MFTIPHGGDCVRNETGGRRWPEPETARGSEVELKLTGDSDALAAVFDGLTASEVQASPVVSTYYDTADRRLWRKGLTLRLRRDRGRHEITLKQERGFVRGEWTSIVEVPVPDVSRLTANAPHRELDLSMSQLAPVLVSEIRRRRTRLTANAACMEISLDTGTIVAGGREAPVAELEFELLSGPVADMLGRVRAIVARHGLSVFTCSKAARGMALLDGAVSASTRAAKPRLHPDEPLDSAVRQIVDGVATHILENMPVAVAGRDPEGVHQVRVALRRLRSAIGLFRDDLDPRAAVLERSARQALGRLGAVRDLDVMIMDTIPRVSPHHGAEEQLSNLSDTARERLVDARKDIRRLSADPAFNGFLIDLLYFAQCGGLVIRRRETPVGRIAGPMLRKRHRKWLKAGRNFATLEEQQRHRVRIATKKLRYACDFFHALYPAEAARPYIRRLAKLQKHLGRYNDLTVSAHLTADLLSDNDATHTGAGKLRRVFRKRLGASESRLRKEWKRAARAKPFWRSMRGDERGAGTDAMAPS